jgi:hypothetical protein
MSSPEAGLGQWVVVFHRLAITTRRAWGFRFVFDLLGNHVNQPGWSHLKLHPLSPIEFV